MTATQKWIRETRRLLADLALSDPIISKRHGRKIGELLGRAGRLPKPPRRGRSSRTRRARSK